MPDLTQRDAAERLGISASWLRELTKREVIYRNSDRSYPWPKARDQFRAFQRVAEEERQAGFGDVPYEAARARKVAAQARLAEFEAAEREGHLIQTEDHIAVIADILTGVREAVLSLPTLASEVVGLTTLPQAQQALVKIGDTLLLRMVKFADELQAKGR